MVKKFFLLAVLMLQGCIHLKHSHQQPKNLSEQDSTIQSKVYQNVKEELIKHDAKNLKECYCMKAFYRNPFHAPNHTSKYLFDQKIANYAASFGNKSTINTLAIGSGYLLAELTAFANILAKGKNLNIYLLDYAYLYYQEPNFKEKLLKFRERKDIPIGDWTWYISEHLKNKSKEEYIDFFETHYKAIDQFKQILRDLDQIYNTTTTVTVLNPPIENSLQLPSLDAIMAIDAYLDLPTLIKNLHYRIKLRQNEKVRFFALNKNRPLGGFWDVDDLKDREEFSKKPITLDIYDLSTDNNSKTCYNPVEHTLIDPTQEQLKDGVDFIKNPDNDPVLSPLETQH